MQQDVQELQDLQEAHLQVSRHNIVVGRRQGSKIKTIQLRVTITCGEAMECDEKLANINGSFVPLLMADNIQRLSRFESSGKCWKEVAA